MDEFTNKNPAFFYDANKFSFLHPIRDNFDLIRGELLDLVKGDWENQWMRTFPSYVRSENKKAWKVFSFIFFGMRFPDHAKLCPKTAQLIYSIPQIFSCDYSFMKPHTHILPHKGYTRMALRCHLPLVVPEENLCGLRVGSETIHWKAGELIIFDDSFDHEAWNKSEEPRVVLMFDIPNPAWGYTADEISKYKIEHLDDPFLLSYADKEQWQEAYRKKIFPVQTFSD